ncbi:MAG: DUF3800 domain-containing protein [Candidatus Latescibacteria bacterium]|nr:DUF3800 domain-containing protein [Candidatus Latescibacterota bacterium]
MYLCYLDESGTSSIPGNTSHFVLAGVSIPVWHWRDCDRELQEVRQRFALGESEIHVAWILRPYLEQRKIPRFDSLDYSERRRQVTAFRTNELLRLQRKGNSAGYRQARKNYAQTDAYVHLTHDERKSLVAETARRIGRWGFARLFAECIDKVHFSSVRNVEEVDQQSLEQVASRFERYLQLVGSGQDQRAFGLLIHDNNPTVAHRQTMLMREFHRTGTPWTDLESIIETPLFVDSSLTAMVQVADLCAYAMRRYLENGEYILFDLIFDRADRKDGIVVGVRHFTKPGCNCKICVAHRR